ncbi:MAG: DUF6055 domain-containing protein [Myxococcales bacterium]|nr:DUF6055 domain-containing protein [Myxococcales bacterium]
MTTGPTDAAGTAATPAVDAGVTLSMDEPMAGTSGDAVQNANAGTGGGDAMDPFDTSLVEPNPVCELPEASEFQPNRNIGGGGLQFQESDHFRVYGSGSDVDATLDHLEAAHRCFVEDWCFRSPGLSVHSDDGPYYKFNVYGVATLGGAGGVMRYDAGAGLSYLEVLSWALPDPRTTIHEFGHSLTLTEYGWVDQTRTGAWWETVANWVADTYLTSSYCEAARNAFGVSAGDTIINLDRVIGQSHMLIVSDQNYYEAWPFLTYLTNNPDGYQGLGRMVIPELFRNHPGNNETPLHVLERLTDPVPVQTILGRYWARMAYLDIEHPQAQQEFFARRGGLDFPGLDAQGDQTYRIEAARRPAYGGANIIPLEASGEVGIVITSMGSGQPDSGFTATLSIRGSDGSVRYVDLPEGVGQASVGSGEEASLVVVNTPNVLYQYDAFQTGAASPEAAGLDYQVRITGAVPTN